jgi:biopolymer transport protein ExbB/biopolymer transport protein TolQ
MLIERLLKVALLGSEWILYLLIILSVLSIATMVERFIFFRRRTERADELHRLLAKALDQDDLESVAELLEKRPSYEARVAREALRWAPSGPEAMADAVDSELGRAKKDLERGLNFLGTLGNNAPFVGLFGTVLGVIMAFNALGSQGQNTSAMGGVMAAIAEALVATGVGLFVALPAVVAYNVIQKRIGEIETESLALTKLISAHLKAGLGQRSANTRSPENAVAQETPSSSKAQHESQARIEAVGAA